MVGYVRVSTDDQGSNGSSLESQRQAIAEECGRRDWTLVRVEEDVQSGGSMSGRPGLQAALNAVEGGEAAALVVAKLDRLSRSLIDSPPLSSEAGSAPGNSSSWT